MSIMTSLAAWPWMLVWGLFAAAAGAYLHTLFTRIRGWKSISRNVAGGVVIGLVGATIAGSLVHDLLVVVPAGVTFGYLGARMTRLLVTAGVVMPAAAPPAGGAARTSQSDPVNRVPLQNGWDRRPRYETLEDGLFVGRRQLLKRLTDDFTARNSGTILISGVRGVGKTALVERALIQARDHLQAIYWEKLQDQLLRARSWNPDSWLAVQFLRVARLLPQSVTGDPFRDAAAEVARVRGAGSTGFSR